MKRWNGWGDEKITYPFPPSARDYLASCLGPGSLLEDASLADTLATVPPTRLKENPLYSILPTDRLLHARGQSLPDWIALRSGQIGMFPDGVAFPQEEGQVQALLDFARKRNITLIPYGGGTSVVGHINPLPDQRPVLTVDMSGMNHLLALDETSWLATFEAGVSGPQLESELGRHGFTLGHFPQSFDYSTLGGWVATRSSGQQSYHYGRIENLFAGGRMLTFSGEMELPPLPASAAGPDIKQLLLGSEGHLGILTRAVIRVQRLPRVDRFQAAFFHDWQDGVEAVRAMAQAGVGVSMLRLSNPRETETTLALAGREDLVRWLDRGLNLGHFGPKRCLLIYGLTGSRRATRQALAEANHLIRNHHGLATGTLIGSMWRKSRFTSPYLRNTLWEAGYALDTLETALPWSNLSACADELLPTLQSGLVKVNEPVLAFAHLSHVYVDGVSLYVTYLFRRVTDPVDMLQRWERLKSAASEVIIKNGGTISHQHGVGHDHVTWLGSEKSMPGMYLLETACAALDPQGLLNPGKLLARKGKR